MTGFVKPEKLVKSSADIQKWQRSDAYAEYLGFLQAVGEAVKGKKIRDATSSPRTQRVLDLLQTLGAWIEEIPPLKQEQRFGNKAFRTWHARLEEQVGDLLRPVLEPDNLPSATELAEYLKDGFGNPTRIDYGTGHEMAFVMFLGALFKVRVLLDEDKEAVGLAVFDRYMRLVRSLQQTYCMEPAGSQGVWSLDDYQFVPFIWGAAQLSDGRARVRPKALADYEVAHMLAPDYHVFGCIEYISKVKSGPFAEHSNQLWNVSGVPNWEKVWQGLVKMYRAEVLSKFPVIQHLLFGSVFTLKPAENPVPPMDGLPSRGVMAGTTRLPVPMARMPKPNVDVSAVSVLPPASHRSQAPPPFLPD